MVETEEQQAALDRAARLVAAEVASLEVAVGLGGQQEAGRDATSLAQHASDAALALAVAVGG